MLKKALAVLVLALLPSVAAAQVASCLNEPSGSTLLTNQPFDTIDCASGGPTNCPLALPGWAKVWGSGAIVTDGTAPKSPSNVYRDQWVNHSFSDIANPYYTFPGGTSRLYMCVQWKPSNPFHGWTGVTTQKLFLLEGSHTYLSMNRIGGGGASSVYTIAAYPSANNNNCHVAQGTSCDILNPNVNGVAVPLGQWNKLEWFVSASTTSSSRDGIIKWWLNGTLVGNYTNINTSVQTFSTIMLTHVWDAVDGQQVTDRHWTDNVLLRSGGQTPGGGGQEDTTPPTQVTGLQVTATNATSLGLSWTAATDNVAVSGYNIEQCSGAGCSNFVSSGSVSGTSTTITGLTPGTSYSFRVKARDSAGNVSVSYSSTVTATTLSTNLPSITSVVANENGADVTYEGDPASIRVQTDLINIVEPISAFTPGAVETPVLVQKREQSGGGGSSFSITYDSNNTAGNHLGFRFVRTDGPSILSVTDTAGNTWLPIPNAAGGIAASQQSLYYVKSAVGGSNTVTVQLSGFVPWRLLDVWEFSNVDTANPLDKSTHAVQLDPGTATDAVSSGAVTTTANGELVIGATTRVDGIAPQAVAVPGTNFTALSASFPNSPTEYLVQAAAGSIACTFTTSDANDDFVTACMTFRAKTASSVYSRAWAPGTTFVCFYARDASGNENPDSRCDDVTVSGTDTTPPARSNAAPVGPLADGTTSTVISLNTDEQATCKYDTTIGTAYASMANTMTAGDGGLTHSATVTGLTDGNTFTYYVRCSDVAGNPNTNDFTITFDVSVSPSDTTAPSQVTGLAGEVLSSQSQIGLTWEAATDDTGVTGYEVFYCDLDDCVEFTQGPTVSGTQTILTGLSAGSTYSIKVRAIDLAVNRGDFSDQIIVSLSSFDTTSPGDVTGLTVTAVDFQTLDLEWTAGTDDVGVVSTNIEQCEGSACTAFHFIGVTLNGTTMRVAGLRPQTTYRFRGKHVDSAGNVSTAYNTPVLGTTLAVPDGTVMGICPCRHRR